MLGVIVFEVLLIIITVTQMTVIRVSSLLFTRHVQSVRCRQSRVKYVMQPKRTLEQLNAACSNLLTYAEPWHSWEILGKSQSHDFSEKKNGGGV